MIENFLSRALGLGHARSCSHHGNSEQRFANPVIVGSIDHDETVMARDIDRAKSELARLMEQVEMKHSEVNVLGMQLAHHIEDRIRIPGHVPYERSHRTGQVIMDQEMAEHYSIAFEHAGSARETANT